MKENKGGYNVFDDLCNTLLQIMWLILGGLGVGSLLVIADMMVKIAEKICK